MELASNKGKMGKRGASDLIFINPMSCSTAVESSESTASAREDVVSCHYRHGGGLKKEPLIGLHLPLHTCARHWVANLAGSCTVAPWGRFLLPPVPPPDMMERTLLSIMWSSSLIAVISTLEPSHLPQASTSPSLCFVYASINQSTSQSTSQSTPPLLCLRVTRDIPHPHCLPLRQCALSNIMWLPVWAARP
jgi:hypothetical protein